MTSTLQSTLSICQTVKKILLKCTQVVLHYSRSSTRSTGVEFGQQRLVSRWYNVLRGMLASVSNLAKLSACHMSSEIPDLGQSWFMFQHEHGLQPQQQIGQMMPSSVRQECFGRACLVPPTSCRAQQIGMGSVWSKCFGFCCANLNENLCMSCHFGVIIAAIKQLANKTSPTQVLQ